MVRPYGCNLTTLFPYDSFRLQAPLNRRIRKILTGEAGTVYLCDGRQCVEEWEYDTGESWRVNRRQFRSEVFALFYPLACSRATEQ